MEPIGSTSIMARPGSSWIKVCKCALFTYASQWRKYIYNIKLMRIKSIVVLQETFNLTRPDIFNYSNIYKFISMILLQFHLFIYFC